MPDDSPTAAVARCYSCRSDAVEQCAVCGKTTCGTCLCICPPTDPTSVATEMIQLWSDYALDRERGIPVEVDAGPAFRGYAVERAVELAREVQALNDEIVLKRIAHKSEIMQLREALGCFTDAIDHRERVNWQHRLHDADCADRQAGTDDDDTPKGERLCKCDGPHRIAVVNAALVPKEKTQ